MAVWSSVALNCPAFTSQNVDWELFGISAHTVSVMQDHAWCTSIHLPLRSRNILPKGVVWPNASSCSIAQLLSKSLVVWGFAYDMGVPPSHWAAESGTPLLDVFWPHTTSVPFLWLKLSRVRAGVFPHSLPQLSAHIIVNLADNILFWKMWEASLTTWMLWTELSTVLPQPEKGSRWLRIKTR